MLLMSFKEQIVSRENEFRDKVLMCAIINRLSLVLLNLSSIETVDMSDTQFIICRNFQLIRIFFLNHNLYVLEK